MSADTTSALESPYPEWERGVRKSMNDFLADGSTILIKIVAGENLRMFRVSTHLKHDRG